MNSLRSIASQTEPCSIGEGEQFEIDLSKLSSYRLALVLI
jgi:hypothetical protein